MNRSAVVQRSLGAILLLVGLLTVGSNSEHWAATAVTWASLLAGTYLLTHATFALLLTTTLLATLSYLGGNNVPNAWVYLSIALICGSTSMFLIAQRFRTHIHNTRALRWKDR